jgi:hypothetical protein
MRWLIDKGTVMRNMRAIWMAVFFSVVGMVASLWVLFAFNGGDLALAASIVLLVLFAGLALRAVQFKQLPSTTPDPDVIERV